MSTRRRRPKQLTFLDLKTWGGRRRGAGRKPNGDRAGVSHLKREKLASRFPVHVTVRLQAGLPTLRNLKTETLLRSVFAAGAARFGFRLVHYSIQSNHLHFMVEAKDTKGLSRGMQGLKIRIAKARNRLWNRKGSVFSDRYHAEILRTPRQVRNALRYVLHNVKKHGGRLRNGLDRFCSGWWFDGWKEKPTLENVPARPVAGAHSWLLRRGWRRCGLISVFEKPG